MLQPSQEPDSDLQTGHPRASAIRTIAEAIFFSWLFVSLRSPGPDPNHRLSKSPILRTLERLGTPHRAC